MWEAGRFLQVLLHNFSGLPKCRFTAGLDVLGKGRESKTGSGGTVWTPNIFSSQRQFLVGTQKTALVADAAHTCLPQTEADEVLGSKQGSLPAAEIAGNGGSFPSPVCSCRKATAGSGVRNTAQSSSVQSVHLQSWEGVPCPWTESSQQQRQLVGFDPPAAVLHQQLLPRVEPELRMQSWESRAPAPQHTACFGALS